MCVLIHGCKTKGGMGLLKIKRSGPCMFSPKKCGDSFKNTLISVWEACWCLFMRLTRGETRGLVTLVALLVKGRTWRAIAPLSCFDIAMRLCMCGETGMTRSAEARDQWAHEADKGDYAGQCKSGIPVKRRRRTKGNEE